MGWFDIGGMGKAIWGAVTKPFTPPPPPPAPPRPVMQLDASRIQSGGIERLRQAALIDPRHPGQGALIDPRHPGQDGRGNLIANNAGSLIGNNSAGLIANNTASFTRPWWQFWR